MGENLSDYSDQCLIDASGKYVLPGAIDSHCHPVYSDKMDTYSVTAAYGGITTVIAFVGNVSTWGFSGYTVDIVKQFIEDGERLSHLDFSVHGTFTASDEDSIKKSVPALIDMGIISFKMFMAYRQKGMMISDDGMIQVMNIAGQNGGLPMVHAENGCCIDFLTNRHLSEGKTSPEWFLKSQPNFLEVEGLYRSATFSKLTNSPLYPVHLSARESLPLVRKFREDGVPVYWTRKPAAVHGEGSLRSASSF